MSETHVGVPVHEFVVFDKHGNETDWIDPYDDHEEIEPDLIWVDNGYGRYRLEIPEGGRWEIRPLKETRND